MASRTKLIGIQYYDNDGGLDFYILGSQWLDWYEREIELSLQSGSKTRVEIKARLLNIFEKAVDRALDMHPADIRKALKDD